MNADEALKELELAHPLDLRTTAIAEVIAQQAARISELEQQRGGVVPERCKYCDGTGDVHSLDGEWLGSCTECRLNPPRKFRLGDPVRKTKGSQWSGRVVGFYSTEQTPDGYAVESFTEKGIVQIYPGSALEPCEEPGECVAVPREADYDALAAKAERYIQEGISLADQRDALAAECQMLQVEIENARRTANYWKAEHLAGNAVIERLHVALETIAGRRQCLDNLMSNPDIANAALAGSKEGE